MADSLFSLFKTLTNVLEVMAVNHTVLTRLGAIIAAVTRMKYFGKMEKHATVKSIYFHFI